MKFTTVAISIVLLNAISGLFSANICAASYEFKNGPNLVTPGFCTRVNRAIDADSDIFWDYLLIPSIDKKMISFYAGGDKGEILLVRELTPEKYSIVTYEATKKYGVIDKLGKYKSHSLVTLQELNKLIDEKVFPDSNSRSTLKEEILGRIDKLVKLEPENTPN